MSTQTIPQMIAAHNRAVRANRRMKRVGAAISATITLMGFFAVSLGVITLAVHLVATAAQIAVMGGAQ